jgi:hypothetical protein
MIQKSINSLTASRARCTALFLLCVVLFAAHEGAAREHSVSLSSSCSLPYRGIEDPDWVLLGNLSSNNQLTDNKSMVLRWTPSYVRNRDVPFPCNGAALSGPALNKLNELNQLNLARRSMLAPLTCNYTNITNNASSLVFYNLSVSVNILDRTYPVRGPATWRVTTIIQGHDGEKRVVSLDAPNQGPFNATVPYRLSFPSLRVLRNASTNATLNVTITPNEPVTSIFPKEYQFNVTAYFQCEVYYRYEFLVLGDDAGSAVLFAFLIPLGLIALVALFAFVRYKFPHLFQSGGPNDPSKNNQQMQSRAGASQPMLISDKAGMATWLDQAEDVVADLNKTQLYLAEAQPDKDPNTNNDLETLVAGGGTARGSGDKSQTLDAHKDGFIGGRKVFAAGGAVVQQKDHKVTMAVKPTPVEEDFL